MVTSNDYITDILEICLERMRAGDSSAACLHDYPHCAGELAPLLSAAEYARGMLRPQLSPTVRQTIQRQLRSAVIGHAPRRPTTIAWYRMPALRFATALVFLVLAIGGGATGVAAAQSSLPGSPLYAVKRASEGLRLSLTASPDRRAALHLDFAQARLAETLALLHSQQLADERVLDDLAREYELAWANIQLLPAGEAQAQRARFIAEGQAEVVALTEALGRAPQPDHPAIEATLRSNQAMLIQAIEKDRSTPPKTPAGDHQPTPGHNAPPTNSQGSGPGQGQPAEPGHGQGNGNGQGQPTDPGHGNGNGQGQPAEPGNDNSQGNSGNGQPAEPGQSQGNGQGQGQGQPADPGNRQDNGSGNSQKNSGDTNSDDKDKSDDKKNGHP